MMRRPARGEDGSVLILSIGLLWIALLAVAVLVDASGLLLERRSVAATADAAALAGAQAIDHDRYYRYGARADGALRLDAARVQRTVRDHLVASGAFDRHRRLRIDSVEVRGAQVRVNLSSRVELPFSTGVTGRSVGVAASSSAQLVVGG